MKLLFLIPPSEGKSAGGNLPSESLSYDFKKPLKEIHHLSEKDLKCKGKRYNEALELNKNIFSGPFMQAIERYNGEMFKAIDYKTLSEEGKRFFEESILIVSSMYGLVKPLNYIGNYKLPIEAKGCIKFWQPIITKTLSQVDSDIIISFLPESYLKVIDIKKLKKPFIKVNFLTLKNGKEMKMAHGSKKVKGEYIRNICEKQLSDFNTFGGKISQENSITSVNFYENT